MGRHPLGGHTQGRDQWLLQGSGCGLGIWVGGSFSFTTNSLVQLGTGQTDYRLHLPFVYKIPTEGGVADTGLPCRSSACERTMDPDTPPPGWLSVGTLPCPYASRTSLHHTPPDLRPVFLGSCSGQACPSVSLHVTRNQEKYTRNQSSEGPCDLPKPPSWGLAVLKEMVEDGRQLGSGTE